MVGHLLGALQYSPPCAGMTRGWGGIPAAPSAHRWHSRQSARGDPGESIREKPVLGEHKSGDTAYPGRLTLNCTNHSRERKRRKNDAGQTRTLEVGREKCN